MAVVNLTCGCACVKDKKDFEINSREAAFSFIWSHDKTDSAAANLEMAGKLHVIIKGCLHGVKI